MCEGGSLPLRIADPCGGCYGIHVPPGPGEDRPTKGVHTYVVQNPDEGPPAATDFFGYVVAWISPCLGGLNEICRTLAKSAADQGDGRAGTS